MDLSRLHPEKIFRHYEIEWYPTKEARYGEPIHTTTTITLSKPIGVTAVDAKAAVGVFINTFGGLKKNTIVRIKEFGPNGQIGEDIIPSDSDSIVPVK